MRHSSFFERNLKIGAFEVKEHAYKLLVRSVLEDASSLLDPHSKKDTSKIETVRKRTASFVRHRRCNALSVSDMLQELQWRWPSFRREERPSVSRSSTGPINDKAHVRLMAHQPLQIQTRKRRRPTVE